MTRDTYDTFSKACSAASTYCTISGYVAIWITNKYAIRQRAMQEMNKRGFMPAEEWIWIKVTCRGEAVTILNGIWRKPYEILMIFRRADPVMHVRRRFIFAVPSVHSQKPNLKYLFGTILQGKKVFEMFARSLTTDWLCTGNEVLKFQDSRWWTD